MRRAEAPLDDLARAVAEGLPRRVMIGRIGVFIAAFVAGDPAAALGARKRCPKGRRRCGKACCKPGYVCRTKKGRKHCVCPKPRKVCGGRCVDAKTDPRNCGTCGHRCASDETCAAGTCTKSIQTVEPTCTDGVKNGSETDVDCGGPTCPKCADGKACASAGDCASGVCTGGVCVPAAAACSADTCGAQHGCPACANGKTCSGGADCASGHCAGGVCVACNSPSDCAGTDTECQARTCVSGTCGMTFADAGTALAAQTAGDCKKVVCDGSGSSMSVNDDADVPDDGNPCTQDLCTNGTPSHPFADPGTPTGGAASCQGNSAMTPVCDGAGGTTQQSQPCAPYLCTGGSCGTSCTSPADCAPTFTCVSNNCVPAP